MSLFLIIRHNVVLVWSANIVSIAISALIKPSRLLFGSTYGMCLGITVVGIGAGLGFFGHFAVIPRLFIAAASIICVLFALFQLRQQRKLFMLDISGIGDIRLMQYDEKRCTGSTRNSDTDGGYKVVRLMEESILWSGLMFLSLKSESGRITVMRIFPDSVSQQEFRALSVACRWIRARRKDPNILNHG